MRAEEENDELQDRITDLTEQLHLLRVICWARGNRLGEGGGGGS